MNKRILIVEDNTTLVKALSISLKEEKFEVYEAHNGEEGLASAEKLLPDLILCDINMPKMDGLTMLSRIRGTKWGKNLLFIMLTNYSDQQKISEALSNSVFTYLVKSDWDLSQIVDEVKKNLK